MKVSIGEYPEPSVDVRIDKEDTWSMDYTLAHIILPMLIQLKATKHGSPFTDDEDVPEELRSTVDGPKINKWDTDSNFHKRWEWVLNEMIWAFTEKCEDDWLIRDDWEEHQKRMTRAFSMFGRYYENLWD